MATLPTALQLKDVHVFQTVAGTQNLRAAAELLGQTQPALSKSIRRLETALGVSLFERTARGVALTPIGQVFLERARTLASLVQDIRGEIAEHGAGAAGVVRIGVVPTMIEPVLAPVLARLTRGADALRFEVKVQLSADLLRHLEAGQLDLAVAVPSTLPHAELGVARLGEARSFIAARRGHPLARRHFVMADLLKEKWMLPPADLEPSRWLRAAFHDAHLASPPVAVLADASPYAFATLIRNSNLLTIMTDDMLRSPLGAGLALLPPPAPSRTVHFAVFWRRKAFFSAALQRTRAELGKAFKEWGRGAAAGAEPRR